MINIEKRPNEERFLWLGKDVSYRDLWDLIDSYKNQDYEIKTKLRTFNGSVQTPSLKHNEPIHYEYLRNQWWYFVKDNKYWMLSFHHGREQWFIEYIGRYLVDPVRERLNN